MASWNDTDDRYLSINYHNTDNQILADYLGRTVFAVASRAGILGLRKSGNKPRKETWAQPELDFITNNYGKLSVIEMAIHLKKSRSSIFAKLEFLGLHNIKRQSAKGATSGKHYRNCLTAEQCERIAVFLQMLSDAKRVATISGKSAKIDLLQMRESYRMKMG